MRFVDLFAGLGGFHLALSHLGHTCVFACEIDKTLQRVYQHNFGLDPAGDIAEVAAASVPTHEILCAGFPCQPFSKAGGQKGLEDRQSGGLYQEMIRVIRARHPRYLILENVPNLERHNGGKTWETIAELLRKEGYAVALARLSPHQFGIPQIRERIYVVGSTESLNGFTWPEPDFPKAEVSIRDVLDRNPDNAVAVSDQVKRCLDVWQQFLDRVPRGEKVPAPLWSMEFGATYPYETKTPDSLSDVELRRYRGSHGQPLAGADDRDGMFRRLPSHARREGASFPSWKVGFIQKNRAFYERHKAWLDVWNRRIIEFPPSFQKLEWNCQEKDPRQEVRDLRKYVIQMRPSGVRVKRPTTAPSLVAMTATQVPIITWEDRYMTLDECKRLQSMEELQYLPETDNAAYAALGNAVSVEVVERIARQLVGVARHRGRPGRRPRRTGSRKPENAKPRPNWMEEA